MKFIHYFPHFHLSTPYSDDRDLPSRQFHVPYRPLMALSVLLKRAGYYSQGPIQTVCLFSRRFKFIRNENYSNNCLLLISGIIPYFSYKLKTSLFQELQVFKKNWWGAGGVYGGCMRAAQYRFDHSWKNGEWRMEQKVKHSVWVPQLNFYLECWRK